MQFKVALIVVLVGWLPMFTSIIPIVIVAFAIGLALGLYASIEDEKQTSDAKNELVHLRRALVAKQLEVDQAKASHEKSVAIAYSVVLDYESLFCEMKKRNQKKQSAVILPFRKNSDSSAGTTADRRSLFNASPTTD